MKFDKSCGAVIYRKLEDKVEFLAVRSRGENGFWGFPKGHMEKLETEEDTCIREVFEETGLRISLNPGFREVDSYLLSSSIRKKVVYFLGAANTHVVNIQVEEIGDFRWGTFSEIYQLLTYRGAKQILSKADRFLTQYKKYC